MPLLLGMDQGQKTYARHFACTACGAMREGRIHWHIGIMCNLSPGPEIVAERY